MTLAALVAAFVVPGLASGHPHTSPKERYFQHRCTQTQTLACIHRAALHWNVPYSSMRYIAHRESRYQAYAKNPQSTASGLFQFLTSTFYGSWNPYRRHSIFSAKYNSLAAAYAIHLGYWSWWRCC